VETKWTASDAWLLHAIVMSCGEKNVTSDFRSIVSCGDYINRSIFNYEEVKDGVERLMAVDYVEVVDSALRLSRKFRRDVKSIKKPAKDLQKFTHQLRELLLTEKLDASKIIALKPEVLSPEKWREAVDAYLES